MRPDEAGWQAHRATLESRLPFRDFEVARGLPDGATRYFAVSGQPRYDSQGLFLGYRGVGRDVTEIALARERIASLAYSDPLTGLANRVSLAPALEQAIERARRQGHKIAGVFMDLDGFKQINDRHGHAAGDAFLVEVAQRLRRHVRASDLVLRPLGRILSMYLFKGGWLDGRPGFLLAALYAYYVFIRSVKAWELKERESH